MKKILAFLVIACAFTAVHAQSREEARRVILGDGSYAGNYSPNRSYGNNRQYEIDRVNRDYDVRIQSVWNDPYLHRGQKKKATRDLERERRIRIDEINRRYVDWDRNRRDHDRDRDWHDDHY